MKGKNTVLREKFKGARAKEENKRLGEKIKVQIVLRVNII